MDPAQALADLTEISSQIEAAVLFDADGAIQGSTLADEGAARRLAAAAGTLLEAATGFRTGGGDVTQLEASTHAGSVFAVCDGPRRIAAVTGSDPTAGLVFYDLKSCLRGAAAEDQAKPKRRRRAPAAEPVVEEDAGEA